jgi:hypothetical protein
MIISELFGYWRNELIDGLIDEWIDELDKRNNVRTNECVVLDDVVT